MLCNSCCPSVPIHSYRTAYSYSQDCSFVVAFALHPCSLQTVRRISLVFHMNPYHFCINSALICALPIVLYIESMHMFGMICILLGKQLIVLRRVK